MLGRLRPRPSLFGWSSRPDSASRCGTQRRPTVYHTDTRDTVILAETIEDRDDPLDPLPSDPVVRVRLEVTDAGGQVVTTVQAGETFTLNMYVQDLRDSGRRRFATYADILYPARLVSADDGEITYGESVRQRQVR